jgi:hypothetical protein
MSRPAAIALPSRPAVNRLDPRQQCILDAVIDAAQRKPGGHVATDRNRWSYWAIHFHGRTRWSATDAYGFLIASGATS